VDAERAQLLAQFAEGAVHAGDLAEPVALLLRLVGVEGPVAFGGPVRAVRRAEPDDRQKRALGLRVLLDELQRRVTMLLSPWVWTAVPSRLRMGSLSKKFGAESHSSNPLAPGLTGLPLRTGPRCHLPKWPVA